MCNGRFQIYNSELKTSFLFFKKENFNESRENLRCLKLQIAVVPVITLLQSTNHKAENVTNNSQSESRK